MIGIADLYDILLAHYGDPHWWPAKTPYEMMVGAILTQNTAWANVEKALANFGDNLTPEFVETASIEDLIDIIRPSGFFNQKSLRLKSITGWYKQYNYDIIQARRQDCAELRAQLLAVNGVGRETADSILVYALDKPSFVVDAYTRRILSRIGYDLSKDYDDIRLMIEQSIPQDLVVYNRFHALIVVHAKEYCKVKAVCVGCPLAEVCGDSAVQCTQLNRSEAEPRSRKYIY